ncbi:OmpA family protein [Paracoccus suum]|uniref:OmpA family protein n=1 Tax=Paracoccus suum TaxID=2259340 RepID=A0A344PKI2_9RHOB|nr:OmpA family protein [Paracoccus suum]AXC49887.1 OmpA family protein [Paracoccus suum]
MKLRAPLILATAGVMAVSACATDQLGNPVPANRAQTGAILGAAAGAAYGLQRDSDSSNKGRDIVRGAAAGALVGGLAGSALDAQARALQQSVTTPGVTVVKNGNVINVNLPESILFATDSAAVSGVAVNDLYSIARNLNSYPNTRVDVIGHTDNTGSAAHNQDLSERRARAVAGILSAGGVASNRIATAGRGFTQPIASNATPQGRAQNRRVEIIIRPM